MNPILERISVDPDVCFGKPSIRGTRVWVSVLLDFLANGMSVEEVLIEYPQLTEEDVRAAIAYGAEMSRERYVEVPIGAAGWSPRGVRLTQPRPNVNVRATR